MLKKAMKLNISHIAKTYKLQQNLEEWTKLLTFLSRQKLPNILEIGTADGGSMLCMSNFAKLLVTVDYKKPSNMHVFKEATLNGCEVHFINYDVAHNKCMPKIKKILGDKKINFLFIDGEHTYEGVKRDFYRFLPLMDPKNSYIAIHDIVNKTCKVSKFWKQIRKKYPSFELIHSEWAGIGVVKYIPGVKIKHK